MIRRFALGPSCAALCLTLFLTFPQKSHAGIKGPPPAPEWTTPPPRIFVLAVGIDHYHWNSPLLNALADLSGSVNDAQRLASVFRTLHFSSSQPQVQVLTDNAATKEAIRAELQKWAQLASPQDMFVFSFSGHALILGAEKAAREVYLAPFDYAVRVGCKPTSSINDFHCIELPSLISGSLLYSWMTQIRSRRQVLLLDASHTDKAVPIFDRYWHKEACSVGPEEMKRVLMLTNHGPGWEGGFGKG